MLKRRLCDAAFTWKLTCEGPLLIADGRYDKEKEREGEKGFPDKVFISRARSGDEIRSKVRRDVPPQLPFYVPGTSLRGPFRAQAERILRSLLAEEGACDPFDMESDPPRSCSKLLDGKKHAFPYAAACPACKLFGCTGTASRVQIGDADVGGSFRSVYRDMIGIDRFTGGVHSGANMRFHALENTAFETTVAVRNFELWQLGLLAYVFRDFAEGLVAIGFGKSKGFGQVKGEVKAVTLSYPAGRADGKVQHLGSLCPAEERTAYGLAPFDAARAPLTEASTPQPSLYKTYAVADLAAFWAAVAPAFNDFAERRAAGQESSE